MTDINVQFCRAVLKLTLAEVLKRDPDIRLRDAWVYKSSTGDWEFHYRDFYWYGDADNAFDARANGWNAWLDSDEKGETR